MNQPLAVIMGAGPLIGLALAQRIAREGFQTALVGLDAAWLGDVCRELPGSRGYVQDLGEPGAAATVLRALRLEQGEPQVLIYHASAGERMPASHLEPERLLRELRINALAPLEAVQEVLPAMRKRREGTLLFTGGGLALKPQAELASGSIGKAAVRQLALCLAAELEPEGIHAATVTIAGFVQRESAFHPGLVADAFWDLHAEPRGAWRSEVVLRP